VFALTPWKEVLTPIEEDVACSPEPVCAFIVKQNLSLFPFGNGTLHCSSHIIVTTLTNLSQVPCHWKLYLHMMQGNRFH